VAFSFFAVINWISRIEVRSRNPGGIRREGTIDVDDGTSEVRR
jgi:hypothetical protein